MIFIPRKKSEVEGDRKAPFIYGGQRTFEQRPKSREG